MERTEIRITGFGGQGVVLSGVLLGRAALADGLHAVQNQSYGAEARGGAARSEVIISGEPIVYPEVVAPQIMVALSQAAVDRYLGDLVEGGTLITDAELVQQIPDRERYRHLSGAFTQIASSDLGRPIVANMVMLGYLAGVTDTVTSASVREAVRSGVPAGTEDLNLRALGRGLELAQQAMQQG